MSGVVAEPRPTAIVSYWGFGDVDGDWTTKPNADYRKGKLIDKDVAWAGVGQQVLTSTNKTNGRGRATFFLYLKHNYLLKLPAIMFHGLVKETLYMDSFLS